MMWGCRPQEQVKLETAMITNITDTLKNKFDRDTLSIQLPQAFDHLKGEDTSFEMVTSNTIQPVRLCYKHNIVTHSIAMVFVNTHCKGIQYKNAVERGEQACKLFKEELEF